jgi:hypothetical protein
VDHHQPPRSLLSSRRSKLKSTFRPAVSLGSAAAPTPDTKPRWHRRLKTPPRRRGSRNGERIAGSACLGDRTFLFAAGGGIRDCARAPSCHPSLGKRASYMPHGSRGPFGPSLELTRVTRDAAEPLFCETPAPRRPAAADPCGPSVDFASRRFLSGPTRASSSTASSGWCPKDSASALTAEAEPRRSTGRAGSEDASSPSWARRRPASARPPGARTTVVRAAGAASPPPTRPGDHGGSLR